jgi:glycosyltransferase involved in cell wall biosynthesis
MATTSDPTRSADVGSTGRAEPARRLSIIVPAHNEEHSIGRLLGLLAPSVLSEGWQVIVVCNACSDRTEAIARTFEPMVDVIATETPGKTNALNLGDEAARHFPRVYLDADVEIEPSALGRLAAILAERRLLAIAPQAAIVETGTSWAVRAFYSVRGHLPSSREGIGSSGVYMLSEEGRRRFGQFPNVIADDLFVRTRFQPSERATIQSIRSRVHPPRTLSALISTRTRIQLGNRQLRQHDAEHFGRRGESNLPALAGFAMRPLRWPALAVYALVAMRSKLGAKRRLASGRIGWDRDASSRQ